MELDQRLQKSLKVAAAQFNRALCHFDPAPNRANTYPERMVSHYYIRALARALPNAKVLLEIPVKGKSKRGWDNHIDALIFNEQEVIVAEFKVAWAPDHWASLARDLERLNRASVVRDIRKGFEESERTGWRRRRSYIFLGTDVWYPERAKAWVSGRKAGKWVLPKSMRDSRRDYARVYPDKGKDFDGYYLTWALFDFDKLSD